MTFLQQLHLPMLTKLDKQLGNDDLHLHVICFRDQIHDGRLSDILLLQCVPKHFSDVRSLNLLFKLDTSTGHDGMRVHLTLVCDLIKDGRLVDWRPF